MIEFIGIVGVSLIVLMFVFNNFKLIGYDDWLYLWGNLLGSGLLIVYDVYKGPTVFWFLNTFWFITSGYKMWALFWGRK